MNAEEKALARGEAAADAGDFETALEAGSEALAANTDSAAALELLAFSNAQLGHLEAAEEHFERLLSEFEPEISRVLGAADVKIRQDDEEKIEEGLVLLEDADELAEDDEVLNAEIDLLRGLALNQLGAFEDALECLERVLEFNPEDLEALTEKGTSLFELGRFSEAKQAFETARKIDEEDAAAWHSLGLLAERAGEDALPFFKRATELDSEAFPPAVLLDTEEFDAAVANALEHIPAHAKPHLDNVVIDIQPFPDDEEIAEGVSPSILGVFRGIPVTERSPINAADHHTATITLYQNNLQRQVSHRDELIEEINITILHEIGHLLGLDEDDLKERGLD